MEQGGTWREQTHAWLWLLGCCKMEPCFFRSRARRGHS